MAALLTVRLIIMIAMVPAHLLYAVFKLLPLRNKVLFVSRQSDKPSYDFIRLANEISRRSPDTEIKMLCHCVRETLPGRVAYVVEIVRQMYHIATSHVCILDGYAVPVSMMHHRRELLVIQLWHALGAIKSFGYQSIGMPTGRSPELARAMRMHHNYDLALCGCDSMVPVFAEAFAMAEQQVLPLGLPRVDYLLECVSDDPPKRHVATLERLLERYPLLADETRRRILYAPTYRRKRSSILPEMLDALTDSGATLMVKLHDLEHGTLSNSHIVDATGVNVLDLIPMADVIITDYSAVAYEACILGKPVYFYVPDIDEYEQENGLNIDLPVELPASTSTDAAQIANWAMDETRDSMIRESLERLCSPLPDDGCTSSIAELIMVHLGSLDG